MSLKNKGKINDLRRSGVLNFKVNETYFIDPQSGPLMFANSDEFRKISNRNKKKKR